MEEINVSRVHLFLMVPALHLHTFDLNLSPSVPDVEGRTVGVVTTSGGISANQVFLEEI